VLERALDRLEIVDGRPAFAHEVLELQAERQCDGSDVLCAGAVRLDLAGPALTEATVLALGYTNQEIAKKLFISVRTVDTHRAHIMRKLQLETRAELVMFALANGVIGPNAD
jgi:DNA-binding CsgD family transcriptional regulator